MPRLGVAFFCSGFAALLCHVVRQRVLGVSAGSDAISAAGLDAQRLSREATG